jgi:lysophospholipase L1-like esterase
VATVAPPRVSDRAPQPAPPRRQLWIWLAGTAVGFVLVVVIAFMAMFGAGGLPCLGGGGGGGGPEPSATSVREIPARYLVLYREMGSRYDVDWTVLAAIGAQESGHGSNAVSSTAGCIGVMQLCGAFTKRPIAQDGSGDGDIQLEGTVDIADSIASAANGFQKLKNAPPIGGSYADYRQAACGYYGACADANANYADEVMARAVQYGFQGAGAPAPTNPAAGPAVRGPERTLLNLGDSLAVGAGGPLSDALPSWRVDTDAVSSRPTAAGVARLEARPGELPSVLAVSLGTNDAPTATRAFRASVERVLKIAGPDRCVLWIKIRRPPLNNTSYAGLNRVLRTLAHSNDNLRIVDAVGELGEDNVHLTRGGYRTRASAIGDAARGCIADLHLTTAAAAAGTGVCADVGGAGGQGMGSPDAGELATNPNITFANALAQLNDLRFGRLSPRLVALLSTIAQHRKITVTALASDHAPGTNHEAGRAADISIVDDDNCFPPDRAGACWQLAQQLDRIKGCLHATELIYFFDPGPSPDSFAKADHDDHIHVGWDGPPGAKSYDPDTAPCSQQALTGSR